MAYFIAGFSAGLVTGIIVCSIIWVICLIDEEVRK